MITKTGRKGGLKMVNPYAVEPYMILIPIIVCIYFIIAMILLDKIETKSPVTIFKIMLWHFGIIPEGRCPRCSAKCPDWMEHGHGKDGFTGKYWCDNCGLWKEE